MSFTEIAEKEEITEAAATGADATHSAHQLKRRVGRASVWTAASAATPRLLNLAVMAVVARILSPHDFGVFAIAMTVHTVIFSMATLGVPIVLTRGDSDVDEVASTVAGISLLSSMLLSAGLVAFATPIATQLGSPEAAAPLRVLAISLLLNGCFPVPVSLLLREFRAKDWFIAQMAGMLVANALMVVLALRGSGAMSFAWSRVVEHAITGALTIAYARRYALPVIRRKVAMKVLRFGLPVAGAAVLSMMLLNVDYAVIGRQLGPARLGIYTLAFNIASWPTALMGTTITSIVVPWLSRLTNDPIRLREAVATASRSVGLLGFPICALTLALSRPLLVTVYGAKWSAAAPVLSTLAVYGAVAVFCTLFSYIVVSQGKTTSLLPLQLAWLASLVPAMMVGVHLDGIVGAGDAHVIVIIGLVLPLYLFAFSRSGIAPLHEPLRALWYPLMSAVACGAAAAAMSAVCPSAPVKLMLGGLAGITVYAIAISPKISDTLLRVIPADTPLARLAEVYAAVSAALLKTISPARVAVTMLASSSRHRPAK